MLLRVHTVYQGVQTSDIREFEPLLCVTVQSCSIFKANLAHRAPDREFYYV